MSRQNQFIGRKGEELAEALLKERGYKILVRNYKTRLGEVDIIALKKDTICFIEVKSRSSGKFGSPCEALTSFKQRQISKAALNYLKDNNLLEKKARFDVVSIIYSKDLPELDIIENAFELDKSFIY